MACEFFYWNFCYGSWCRQWIKKWVNSDLEFLMLKTDVYSWCFVHSSKCQQLITIVQKMKFSIENFFCKCDQIHSFLRIWSHLLTKSLMENFIFCAAKVMLNKLKFQVSLSYFIILLQSWAVTFLRPNSGSLIVTCIWLS